MPFQIKFRVDNEWFGTQLPIVIQEQPAGTGDERPEGIQWTVVKTYSMHIVSMIGVN